jgi:pyruvate dehydrogenase phosphatase
MFRIQKIAKYSAIACCTNSIWTSQCLDNTKKKSCSSSFPANNPCEDRFVISHSAVPSGCNIFGVFDGHGGYHVSEYASKNLVDILSKHLEKSTSVSSALEDTFTEIEESYTSKIRECYKLGFGDVAKVGSCAIVAVVKENTLTVANSGDCRVVVGSVVSKSNQTQPTGPSGMETVLVTVNNQLYSAYQVNRDHNARTSLERALLNQAHPNEPNIVVCKNSHACYVKGRLQLTRALGDAYLKYPEFNAPASAPRSM